MTGKSCMMLFIPYFENWETWYRMLDVAGKNEQRFIADAIYKYLEQKHNKPEKNTPKAIWTAFKEASMKEGLTIAALIEKAVALELNIIYVAPVQSALEKQSFVIKEETQPIKVERKGGLGSILDLNRDAHKP